MGTVPSFNFVKLPYSHPYTSMSKGSVAFSFEARAVKTNVVLGSTSPVETNDLAVGSQVDSLDLRLDIPLHSRFVEMELENLLLLVLLDAKRGYYVSVLFVTVMEPTC